MVYRHIPLDKTKYTEMGGMLAKIIGKNDLIYLRNRWQRELDNAWAALMNMAHHIEDGDGYKQVVIRSNALAKFRGSVDDTKKENAESYDLLLAGIEKDQAYEERMWGIHQDMHKVSSLQSSNYSRSFKNINVTHEEVKRYVTKYPTTQTSHDINIVLEREKKIKESRTAQRQNIATLRDYFEQFKLELGKLESKHRAYIEIKEDGQKQLGMCRYNNSVFYRLSSEGAKHSMCLDTVSHRLNQVETTIAHFNQVKLRVESIIEVDVTDYKSAISSEFVFDDTM